jgi:uncharacterized repeat protein (TIGR03803 family)
MTNLGPHRNWSWPVRLGVATGALALLFVLGRVLVMTPSAEAHADTTFKVLYSFEGGTDGGGPEAGLVRDAAGNLYGTTAGGGAFGRGTVFKLDTRGTKTVLHTFSGSPLDGQIPDADLILDAAGNLYGTTGSGGAYDYGTVFKLDTTGTETVLHSFPESPLDGNGPFGGLVRDAAGDLYGTTAGGGASNQGTVFKLDTAGKLTVLYSFAGPPLDGQYPLAGLVRDAAGNLYGTTSLGGAPECNYPWGCGTVFKLDTTGTETVLHSFTASRLDGALPAGRLVRDAAGNLYGATERGGAFRKGTVFKLDPTGAETVLHSFAGGTTDGATPLAGLLQGAAGNLYGTTSNGGASDFGTVFRVTTSGTETMLHSMRRNTDGIRPQASLIRDPAGNLYGTTLYGGRFDQGTVFKLSP